MKKRLNMLKVIVESKSAYEWEKMILYSAQ